MSAERMPPEDHAWLARLLGGVTRLVLRFPRATLAVGVGLAIASVLLTAWRLEYKASRVELLSPTSDYNRRWVEYIEEFGEDEVWAKFDAEETSVMQEFLEHFLFVESYLPLLQLVASILLPLSTSSPHLADTFAAQLYLEYEPKFAPINEAFLFVPKGYCRLFFAMHLSR